MHLPYDSYPSSDWPSNVSWPVWSSYSKVPKAKFSDLQICSLKLRLQSCMGRYDIERGRMGHDYYRRV